jgi:hypothetical protein
LSRSPIRCCAPGRLPGRPLSAAHPLTTEVRAFLLDVLVRLGETAQADGSAPGSHQVWQIAAFLLEASARDALGEREAAGRALERGPDLAEPVACSSRSCCIRCLSCLNATRGSALCIPR